MSGTLRCPDCGHPNPAGSDHCAACNFPLSAEAAPAGGATRGAPAPPVSRPLRRPVKRQRGMPSQQLSLWLVFGSIVAAIVIYTAIKANLDRAGPRIEGSNREQQQTAERLRTALAKDSTDVEARVGLANILFDTANWPEAIIHYRSAIRQDSNHVHALVDLGVCYYNLGHADDAERHFRLALQREPHQPVALFNLGIVSERRSDFAKALSYFHRALQSGPPEHMKQPLIEAMQRVQAATGKSAPPLSDGR